MDISNLKALSISRYLTYFIVYLSSLATIEGELIDRVYFSFLFMIVLAISSLRLKKLSSKPWIFIVLLFIEMPIISVMDMNFDSLAMVYFYVIIVDIYLFLKVRVSIVINLIIVIVITLCSLARNSGLIDVKQVVITFVASATATSFFAGAAYLVKKEIEMKSEIQLLYNDLKKSKNDLEEANQRLKDYAERIEDIAVLNERNRLAGEIHDNIGHNLTALIMEIDLCRKLVNKDVNKTKVELDKASELARHTLAEVRRSVKAIMNSNNSELTGMKAINELIREFEKNTEIKVNFRVSELKYKLSPTVEVTLYRTIQEALTNCAKHGETSRVNIEVNFGEGKVWLSIKDNGKGCSDITKGVGLKTMEERVTVLGGRIDFSNEEGFLISVVIPVEVIV